MTKSKYFKLLKNETLIASNLITKCEECFTSCSENHISIKCPIDKESRRQGKIVSGGKTVFLCSNETKNGKLFRQKLDGILYTFSDISIVKEEIENSIRKIEQQKINRLVHNLASLNGYNIQNLYDLVPQEILSNNWREQLKYIKNEINKDVDKTANLYLRLIKNSLHMKSEFSIYRKLERERLVQLDLNYHPIRKVILNILHTFFSDLNDKDITVKVSDFTGRVLIDYETVQVALYHLLENATKYSIPHSQIHIDFEDSSTSTCCKFSMNSLYVNFEERSKIFLEGYSGELARKLLKNGDGIGLWRIKQIMELNNGLIDSIFGEEQIDSNGFKFAHNTFKLIFRK